VKAHVLEECLNERLTDRREVDHGWEKEFLLLAKVSNRLLGEEAQKRPRDHARVGALARTQKPARLNQRIVVVMRQWDEAAVSLHGSRAFRVRRDAPREALFRVSCCLDGNIAIRLARAIQRRNVSRCPFLTGG
jgi:hypothetical protein